MLILLCFRDSKCLCDKPGSCICLLKFWQARFFCLLSMKQCAIVQFLKFKNTNNLFLLFPAAVNCNWLHTKVSIAQVKVQYIWPLDALWKFVQSLVQNIASLWQCEYAYCRVNLEAKLGWTCGLHSAASSNFSLHKESVFSEFKYKYFYRMAMTRTYNLVTLSKETVSLLGKIVVCVMC